MLWPILHLRQQEHSLEKLKDSGGTGSDRPGKMASFNIRVGKIAFTLVCLSVIKVLANITLTVIPSSNVEVNQVVILQCIVLNKNPDGPRVVYFGESQANPICLLDSYNGTCKNFPSSCSFLYNATCLNKSEFNVQVAVPRKWNGMNMTCSTLNPADGISNAVILIVKVPVAFVTMNLTTTNVIAGQEIDISCTTSFCDPPANITWFTSSVDGTNQYKYTNDRNGEGLVSTKSSLQIIATAKDNGMMVYCSASNIPSRSVNSTVQILTVSYKPAVELITPTPYNVKEGHEATMECRMTAANPNTSIIWKWFKTTSQNEMLSDEPYLIIPNITRGRSGPYNCTASNSVGTSDAVTISLDVHYKPDVVLKTPNPYNVKEGQKATMECKMTAANPNTSIIWKWFETTSLNKLSDGPYLMIPNITRDRSGPYSCTASNSVGTSDVVTINLDVQYKPDVEARTPSIYKVIERETANLECAVTAANPNRTITWKWIKTDMSNDVLNNLSIYTINRISRSASGLYNCTAINSVGESDAASISIDVQFKPEIADKTGKIVNENAEILLSREIVSNPLSNVSWFNGSILLRSQSSVKTATYSKKNAACTDTTNFTLIANNGVGGNVTAFVELIVNCKPQLYANKITLGVTDTTGIEFSTTVIAYPEPWYELENENGTRNTKIMSRITSKAVNIFTINFNQSVVNKEDYGTYYLRIGNIFGNRTIFVNVLPQRKPTEPKIIQVNCEERRAIVKWKSSFNGGDSQSFNAFALGSQRVQSESVNVTDNGENKIHSTYVNNLQPAVTYVFYVSAKNRHGSSLSTNISCTTFQESSNNLPLIAGGAAAGGIALATIVIFIVMFIRIYKKHEKRADKSQRFENEVAEKEADDDGMKDNILYVSAGPKEDEKPEAAVYAAVNKKAPESNNNANMYAEVNKGGHLIAEGALYSDVKPKRGLFKKDVGRKRDGNPKQKKGKKQKSKQDVADVYENSEDIAMSSKSDNVYSNTGQKVQNKEERGYKNKDGLLYVEVQFDTKNEKGNQSIHGEDEKTDYATVEFPMAASTHDESGNEKI